MNDRKPNVTYARAPDEAADLRRDLEVAQAELRRLRAVLDAAKAAAERGNWNGCKAALFETGGDA